MGGFWFEFLRRVSQRGKQDTMPIIMAQGSRSYTAKVAFDISHI